MICEKKNMIFKEKFRVELHHDKVLLISNRSEIHQINLNNDEVVDWKLTKDQKNLKYFGILICDEWSYFEMQSAQIELLKQFLDGKVQYRNINSLYRVVKFSGKGSFGQVFKYQSLFDRSIVACKSLKISKQTGEKEFMNEVEALQNLRHPNILRLKEFYIEPKHYYIVTEYLEGGTLAELVRQRKLNDEEILIILKQLLSAINYMHNEGCVYRDIKQQNIMFAEKDNLNSLRIIDLGLTVKAKILHARKQQCCGSPGYIAPETAQNEKKCIHSFKSDVFGIGVLLWEMYNYIIYRIHAKDFISGKDAEERIEMNRVFEFSDALLEKIDNQLFKELAEKMLQHDISKRITSAEALDLIKYHSEH